MVKEKPIIFMESFFYLKEFSLRKEEHCNARILKCWVVDMTYETGALRAFDTERRKWRMSLAYTAYRIFYITTLHRHNVRRTYIKRQFVRMIFILTCDGFMKCILCWSSQCKHRYWLGKKISLVIFLSEAERHDWWAYFQTVINFINTWK